MNWLSDYAARAGLTDAQSLLIPIGSTPADAWESTARVLGLTPSELATRLAPQLKLFPANFARTDTHALRLVPETLARRFNVFPLREDNRQLVIATADPSDLDCEQAIAFASGRRVAFELAPPSAIAQAIDAAYGGASRSEDTKPSGAGRSEDAAQSQADAEIASASTSQEPLVLVVDDDPTQRLLISAALQKNGFRAQQAGDGDEALRRIAAGEEYALILTDLHMPVVGGDEVVRRMRGEARTAALPIIVLTGSSDRSRESELIELGADDYIRKPVEPPLLVARVRAALRRAGTG